MSLLEQFDYLRNNEPQKRLAATIKIFSILDLRSKEVKEVTSLEELKEEYGSDVQYTFTRLIRGLASSRESARLGFSAALSELLRSLQKIDIGMVIETIEKATTPAGNIKGQEIRDYQFGRLFGLQALCSSGLLERTETTMAEITPVFGLLFELAMSKGWLRESCANVIIQNLNALATAGSLLTKECAETVHDMLYTAQLNKTIEGVAISLSCIEHGSSKKSDDWTHGNILHADNLKSLNRILRDLNNDDTKDQDDMQTGTWKPKLHFCWLLIIRNILQSKSDETVKFPSFWRIVVDEGLFSSNASHERKFWGLQLFSVLVKELPHDQITTIFSPNFLRTVSNQIAQNDRYLNKAAKHSTAAMLTAVEANPAKAPVILRSLWSFNLFFDRLSKDRTCESIMLLTPPEALADLVNLLLDQCNLSREQHENTTKEVEKRRQFIADTFLQLLRSTKTSKSGPWVQEILDFFTINGFFRTLKPKKSRYSFTPELSENSKNMFKTRLQSALGCLMPTTTEESVCIRSLQVVRTINEYRSKKYFELSLQPDETILALLESTHKKLDKLEKRAAKKASKDQAIAFILLYSLTMLQIYAGEADAIQILEDLEDCYSRVFGKASTEGQEVEEQDSMEVLTDLLLGFLSRESVLFRKLVESVFAVFASKLTKRSVDLLINVLLADETGQDLFDKDEEYDEDAEAAEDEEMIEQDEADRASSSTDDEQETDSEEEGEEEVLVADNDKDAALDAALMAALGAGTKRKASEMNSGEGHESDFEADDDEEEELMDDEQMLAMDATLENIFKARKQENPASKRQDREGMKTSAIQLKRKVLDLFDIVIKTVPSSELILDLILPTVQAARKSSDQQFAEKAQNLIRQKLTKSKTLPCLTDAAASRLTRLLREIHTEATRSHTPPQLITCSQASLFLVRLLLTSSPLHIGEVVAIYGESQLLWITKKNSKLTTGFFVDFINWSTQWRLNQHKHKTSTEPDAVESEEPLVEQEEATKIDAKSSGRKSKRQKKKAHK